MALESRMGGHEPQAPAAVGALKHGLSNEYPVEHECVEVHIQVERAAKKCWTTVTVPVRPSR